MTTIISRATKGLPLTHTEVDDNFANLNSAKLEFGQVQSAGTANSIPYLNAFKVLTSGSALTFNGSTFDIAVSGSTDALRITQLGTGNALLVEDSSNPDSSPFVIDTAGRVAIGHIATVAGTGPSSSTRPSLQVHGTTNSTSGAGVYNWSSTAALTSAVTFNRSLSNVVGTFGGAVTSSTSLGAISFSGDDGTSFYESVRILAQADGSATTGSTPGRLLFYTTPSGTTTPVERMRIGNSGDITIAGGTANGVTYLNASKVLTSGTALTFDGTNLGVGTNTLFTKFTIQDTERLEFGGVSGAMYSQALNAARTTTIENRTYASFMSWWTGASGSQSEAMRLDASGTLLVGATSTYGGYGKVFKLQTAGAKTYHEGVPTQGISSVDTTAMAAGVGGSIVFTGQYDTSANYAMFAGIEGQKTNATNGNYAGDMVFKTRINVGNLTEKMRLDSSGNLGLGVTPSAWSTAQRAIQLASNGSVASSATYPISLSSNAVATSNGWAANYIADGFATLYAHSAGQHRWFTAPSGTAGNAITFTQAMTLDASGRLGLGTTTQGTNPDQMYIVTKASSKYALHLSHENVGSGAATVGAIRIDGFQGRGQGINTGISIDIREQDYGDSTGINAKVTGIYGTQYAVYQEISKNLAGYGAGYCNYATLSTTNSGAPAYFYYAYDQVSAAAKFYVGQNGGISNYQANDTNLSDRREKTNFAPAGDYLAKICAIPVQTFNYIDQSENDPGLTLGVVAQDVQDVAPELVMESNWGTEETPKMRLSIYQTDLQYALMKCVQEQQALIESLTQRLAAAGI